MSTQESRSFPAKGCYKGSGNSIFLETTSLLEVLWRILGGKNPFGDCLKADSNPGVVDFPSRETWVQVNPKIIQNQNLNQGSYRPPPQVQILPNSGHSWPDFSLDQPLSPLKRVSRAFLAAERRGKILISSFWVSFVAWLLNIYAVMAMSNHPQATEKIKKKKKKKNTRAKRTRSGRLFVWPQKTEEMVVCFFPVWLSRSKNGRVLFLRIP